MQEQAQFMDLAARKLEYYLTPEHACNYLPGMQARTLVADPAFPLNRTHYTRLADRGFRRSGSYVYRPNCHNCSACIPVRINVGEFLLDRRHRRIWRRNRDLSISTKPPQFNKEYFDLYHRYINTRHPGGGMENPAPSDFMQFLTCDWAETMFYEIRLDNRLVAVAVADRLDNGLSAVYTFFDPDENKRSPGIFAILFEIDETARLGLEWLYLGYWIPGCSKMHYKHRFPALQYYDGNCWNPDAPV